MTNRRSWLPFLGSSVLVLSALLLSGVCSAKDAKTLVVGLELAYPPFETTDAKGNPMGISVEMGRDLGKYLKRPVAFENTAWAGLIPSLQTDKIDLIISSMTITAERGKVIDFSEPYAASNLALLINVKSAVKSYRDLDQPGRVLAVKRGSTGHLYAVSHLKRATINVFDAESSAVLEVVQGKADAFTYDQLSIYEDWKANPTTTRLELRTYQDKPEYWGIAIKKGNDELRKQVNSFIKQYQRDGGFDRLGEKYLGEQKRLLEKLKIPFFFDVDPK